MIIRVKRKRIFSSGSFMKILLADFCLEKRGGKSEGKWTSIGGVMGVKRILKRKRRSCVEKVTVQEGTSREGGVMDRRK